MVSPAPSRCAVCVSCCLAWTALLALCRARCASYRYVDCTMYQGFRAATDAGRQELMELSRTLVAAAEGYVGLKKGGMVNLIIIFSYIRNLL